MNATLAHVPTPEPGETLSSLLLRLGRNHAATPHELCSLLWPRFQVWTRDIDRTASDSFLAEIARVTGWSRDLLERATLRGLVKATGFAERTSGCQDGILALGVFHRVRRRFGQQFCPVCLAGLPRYLRLMWRFEFMVTCPEHGVLLRDACPHCDAPFIPHRNQSLILARCYRCGRSLLGGRRKTAPQLAARLQHGIVAAMAAARPDVADSLGTIGIDVSKATILGQIEPAAWLDGVRRLCRLATNEAHRPGTRNGGSAWARIRVASRAAVMGAVWRWMTRWPASWIRWARAADLTYHRLCSGYGPWPDWVAPALAALPDSHGPTYQRRHRPALSLRQLRRRSADRVAYSAARADLLIRKAGLAAR